MESRFRRLGIYKRGEIMALGLIACVITASAAASALAGAGFTIGTADALHAAPLFLSDVPYCEADNQGDNRNYDDVIHKNCSFGNITSSARTRTPDSCLPC